MVREIELTGDQPNAIDEFRKKHRTGLLTLLFTDVVGSTELKRRLGDLPGTELISRHQSLVRTLLEPFQKAQVISTAGDSFFVVFAKASDSVRFALRLQKALRSLIDKSGHPLQVRIGIHMGEVFIEQEQDGISAREILGLQVDIASEVMAIATADQILMTRSVFDNARAALMEESLGDFEPLSWLNHGLYFLKSFEEPFEICEVGERGLARLGAPVETGGVRRYTGADQEPVVGWRPAVKQLVPGTEWELMERLGQGGFGEVWLARNRLTKQQRAFKFCFRADRLRNLKRELTLFRILTEVLGERDDIARLHDVQFDHPPYYLELDYTSGGNLEKWAESRGGIEAVPMPVRLEIVAQIATALSAAHSVGVIHKDVKPSNVLIENTKGQGVKVRLTDFGIGQLVDRSALGRAGITGTGFTTSSTMSQLSSRTGTRIYMAPELLVGKPPSIRSDIYALGVLLYQLAVGDLKRPMATDWGKNVSDSILRRDIRRCVTEVPDQRFGSGDELARRLRALPSRHAQRRFQIGVTATAIMALLLLAALGTWAGFESSRRKQAIQKAAMESAVYYSNIVLAGEYIDAGRTDHATNLLLGISPRRRDWVWGYLQRLCHRSMAELRGHSRTLTSVAYSPDGKQLATSGVDGTVRIWDLESDSEVANLTGHTSAVLSVAFHPNGELVASAGPDGTVRLWDLKSKQESKVVVEHDSAIQSVVFSPDGTRLATACSDGTVRVWDAETGEPVRTFSGHHAGVLCVAFSPDGSRLASGGNDYTARLWSLDGSSATATLAANPPRAIWSVAFSPDGAYLATAGKGPSPTTLWNVRTGTPIMTYPTFEGIISSVAFSPDGLRLATCSLDEHTVRIWNVKTGQQNLRPMRHYGAACLAFSPDGNALATAGADQEARIWDVDPSHDPLALQGLKDQVWSLAFSPDGSRLATADANVWTYRVYDVATGREVYNRHVNATVNAISVSRDGRFIATACRDRAIVWDFESGKAIRTLAGHTTPSITLEAANLDSERKIYPSHIAEGLPKGWHKETGHELATPLSMIGGVMAVDFSPDGEYLATGGGDAVARIWDIETGKELRTLRGHLNYVRCLAFSHDGQRLATGSWDNSVRLWDVHSGKELTRFLDHTESVNALAFSPDGKQLATAGQDKVVVVRDLERGTILQRLVGHRNGVMSIAFSPDGRRVVTGADEAAKVWDIEWGRELISLDRGEGERVCAVAFSPDGRRIATGERRRMAFLWDSLPWDEAEIAKLEGDSYDEKVEHFKVEDALQRRRAFEVISPILKREADRTNPPLQACAENLAAIHAALLQYRADHGDEMPPWLSTLAPDYLSSSVLHCADNLPKSPLFNAFDPVISTSYHYEFSLTPIPPRFRDMFTSGCKTMREWKVLQMTEFGDRVPTVRCAHHVNDVMNLSYGGQIYISETSWENRRWTNYPRPQEANDVP